MSPCGVDETRCRYSEERFCIQCGRPKPWYRIRLEELESQHATLKAEIKGLEARIELRDSKIPIIKRMQERVALVDELIEGIEGIDKLQGKATNDWIALRLVVAKIKAGDNTDE